MLDSRYLRADIEEAAKRLAQRNYTLDTQKINKLESERKEFMTRTQDLQAQRNSLSKSIGQAIKAGQDTLLQVLPTLWECFIYCKAELINDISIICLCRRYESLY